MYIYTYIHIWYAHMTSQKNNRPEHQHGHGLHQWHGCTCNSCLHTCCFLFVAKWATWDSTHVYHDHDMWKRGTCMRRWALATRISGGDGEYQFHGTGTKHLLCLPPEVRDSSLSDWHISKILNLTKLIFLAHDRQWHLQGSIWHLEHGFNIVIHMPACQNAAAKGLGGRPGQALIKV